MKNRTFLGSVAAMFLLGGCGMILGFEDGIEKTKYYGMPKGDPLPDIEQINGDCQKFVYDGLNGVTSEVDDTDTEDGDSCTADSCMNGIVTHAFICCDPACTDGKECINGACLMPCLNGEIRCGTMCVDLQTDKANCGACGTACSADQSCIAGQCLQVCMGTIAFVGGGSGAEDSNLFATGHLDGDSTIDLVRVVGNAIRIAKGDGAGKFEAIGILMPSSSPNAIRLADINNDKKLDIVTQSISTTSIFLGKGDGTFEAEKSFSIGGFGLAIDDLTGDMNPDLVFLKNGSVSVLRNNGSGSFDPATLKSAISTVYPQGIAIGDFNEDGWNDVAVTNAGMDPDNPVNCVTIFPNKQDAQGGLNVGTSFTMSVDVGEIMAVNLDSDNKLDLAIEYNASIYLMRGLGAGQFASWQSVSVGNGPKRLTAGDLNADGRLDLAVATEGTSGAISVLLNVGVANAPLGPAIKYPGLQPGGITLDDVNNDGKLDVVGRKVLFNHGDGTLYMPAVYNSGKTVLATGDVNKDGRLDIAVSVGNKEVAILMNGSAGEFPSGPSLPVDYDPRGGFLTDLDNDTWLDLTVHSYSVDVMLGDKAGSFSPKNSYATGLYELAGAAMVKNIVGNDAPDLIWVGSSGVRTQKNAGDGTFALQISYFVDNYPRSVAAGDMNGDTYPDLIVASQTVGASGGVLNLFWNNLDGTFTADKEPHTLTFAPAQIALHDLNANGVFDLVIGSSSSIYVMLDGSFGQVQYLGGPQFVIGDINGDTMPDIATTNSTAAVVLYNDGSGGFPEPKTYSSALSGLNAIVSGDLDGNGTLDLAVSNGNATNILLNTCLP